MVCGFEMLSCFIKIKKKKKQSPKQNKLFFSFLTNQELLSVASDKQEFCLLEIRTPHNVSPQSNPGKHHLFLYVLRTGEGRGEKQKMIIPSSKRQNLVLTSVGSQTIGSKLRNTYICVNPRVSSHPEQVMVQISPDFISISAEVPLGLVATCFG